ncbi:MAG TPA: ABC transporter permease [Allosphingosinicella sp.]|nr:ABC transporter permease [Allosphingosinicella sp.]
MAFLQEVAASVHISVKSIPRRAAMSIATVVGIALVVLVLLGFLSMANGFQRTLEGAGSDKVAIVLSKGARAEADSMLSSEQYRLLQEAPGVAVQGGRSLVSGEVYTVVSSPAQQKDALTNVPLRGISSEGLQVRSGFRLSEGRMFTPGSQEIVIGRALQRRDGLGLGQQVRFGPTQWTIVGIVDANGSALESEIWGDLRIVQSLFGMGPAVQSVRIRPADAASLARFEAFVTTDPRLGLDVKTEREFFAAQSRGLSDLMRYLGWPLAGLMALGALAAALNTMHSSVAARSSEIATLRILGFGAASTFVSVLAEALVLSAAGAALGVLLSLTLLQGLTASTVSGAMTTLSFTLQLSTQAVLQAVTLGIGIGLLGGALAAWRGARQPILVGLEQ